MKTLGPNRTELIQITDEEIKELEKDLQEMQTMKGLQTMKVKNPLYVNALVKKKNTENTERKTQLEMRENSLLPLRERIKEIF